MLEVKCLVVKMANFGVLRLVLLETFILKTYKYAYKMTKCIQNISYLSKNHEMFESNGYELPIFEV